MTFLTIVPDASVLSGVALVYGAMLLAIRTLYADSDRKEASAREERLAMLSALDRHTQAMTSLTESVRELLHSGRESR